MCARRECVSTPDSFGGGEDEGKSDEFPGDGLCRRTLLGQRVGRATETHFYVHKSTTSHIFISLGSGLLCCCILTPTTPTCVMPLSALTSFYHKPACRRYGTSEAHELRHTHDAITTTTSSSSSSTHDLHAQQPWEEAGPADGPGVKGANGGAVVTVELEPYIVPLPRAIGQKRGPKGGKAGTGGQEGVQQGAGEVLPFEDAEGEEDIAAGVRKALEAVRRARAAEAAAGGVRRTAAEEVAAVTAAGFRAIVSSDWWVGGWVGGWGNRVLVSRKSRSGRWYGRYGR